jgi:AcrR family transcriptional regulator
MAARKKPTRKLAKALVSPRKAPTQHRAQATCEAILQAAAHILERGGLTALNTNRVAEKAGVSVGSLYQYYPNKDALIVALAEREHAGLLTRLARVAQEAQGLPLAHVVSQIIKLALGHQYDRAELAAALEYAERALPESPTLAMQHGLLLEAAQKLLLQYKREIQGDPMLAALDVMTILRAMVDGAALRGEPRTAALEQRIARAINGYLAYRD